MAFFFALFSYYYRWFKFTCWITFIAIKKGNRQQKNWVLYFIIQG